MSYYQVKCPLENMLSWVTKVCIQRYQAVTNVIKPFNINHCETNQAVLGINRAVLSCGHTPSSGKVSAPTINMSLALSCAHPFRVETSWNTRALSHQPQGG